ncbi:MAG: tRNA lysidine(34) synthetase TilS [Chlamydiales bacterium]|nr:tRNA lysidine(34) synthetase TilS [Chlamydiales bacterium]
MQKKIYNFLDIHLDYSRPLLLALSGGPDSLALFHLLIEYREKKPFELHVAHVDHGWRLQSKVQALHLKEYVEAKKVPFYLKTLDPCILSGNLEDACRKERFLFFEELHVKHMFQAVVLGHHADDQAETVLKRLLENASLMHLCAMQENSSFNSMQLWRPFLSVRKKEIQSFLDELHITAIMDETNLDPKFLRGRMRTLIFPTLELQFGKQIASSLVRLGQEAKTLCDYLDVKTNELWDKRVVSSFGMYLDLNLVKLRLEQSHLIRRIAKSLNVMLTHHVLEAILDLLERHVANKRVETKECTWFIDRGYLFVVHRGFLEIMMDSKQSSVELEDGVYLGNWKVIVKRVSNKELEKASWQFVWQGSVDVVLPLGKYTLAFPNVNEIYLENKTSLDVWWNKHKVPAFLRSCVPVVKQGSKICREFLSGASNDQDCEEYLHISLIQINESDILSKI